MNNEILENNENVELDADALFAALMGNEPAEETTQEVAPEAAPENTTAVAPVAPVAPVQTTLPIEAPEVVAPEKPFGTIDATVKVEDALSLGGIDYEVETVRIHPVLTGILDEEGNSAEPEADWVIPSFTGIRRADDRKVVFTVLRETYTPVQNREILEFVLPILEKTGGEFTRVGCFDNGAQVFAYITLHETFTLPNGKTIKQELILSSSHNGAKCLSLKAVATVDGATIRQSHEYGLRHTKRVHIRADEAVKILMFKDSFFNGLADEISKLEAELVSNGEASDWLKKFLDYPKQADIPVHAAKIAAHDRILDAFKNAVDSKNTKLALALAVAYDRAHTVPVKQTKHFVSEAESRFKSSLNGTSAKELEAAWNDLLK